MKQFNLQEYLANPSRQVVTRDGRKVRIVCTDRKNHDSYPIIALVETDEDDERVRSFKIDGKWSVDELENNFDLFFAPEKKEGWINIFEGVPDNKRRYVRGVSIFKSKEDAEKTGRDCINYITTVKIEWEE